MSTRRQTRSRRMWGYGPWMEPTSAGTLLRAVAVRSPVLGLLRRPAVRKTESGCGIAERIHRRTQSRVERCWKATGSPQGYGGEVERTAGPVTHRGAKESQTCRRSMSPRGDACRSLVFAFLVGIGLLLGTASGARQLAVLLDLKGAIGPATASYVHKGLRKAQEDDATLVILRVDTPGGLDTSMRDVVQDILASPVPVVAFVAPSGARAASAGTFIVYASHIAAMAPGTNLGAATPVQIGGPSTPLPGGRPGEEPDGDKPAETEGQERSEKPEIADKAVNDAVAYIRALAQMRDRNAEWAEKAVREAASLPSDDALREGVIDLIARDVDDLLRKLDGRAVTILGESQVLRTAELELVVFEPDWRTRFLSIITNPSVAYILLLLGVYGLIFEFVNPGLVGPGVIGAISLLLALYAFQLLPINYAGLGLIGLGIALMIGEAFVPAFGALGIGGVAAFVLGSLMLMDTDIPGFGVAWPLIAAVALVSAAFFIIAITLMLRARRRAVVSGREEMIGSTGHVVEWAGHEGRVRVHGEIWRARAQRPLRPHRQICVTEIDGLTLVVEPQPERR